MMNKTDISFIIPAYNASGTIVRTLDSIRYVAEGKVAYEVVVVDDCSPDNTVAVVEGWKSKNEDCSLVILRQEKNHRQGAARNRAIREAKGEYVMFIDADDTVAEGLIDVVRFAQEHHLDACMGSMAWIANGEIEKMTVPTMPDRTILSGRDLGEEYYDTAINNYPVIYICRTKHIIDNSLFFAEDRRLEDGDWSAIHAYSCDKIGFVNAVIYNYFHAESVTSTTNTFSPDVLGDWLNMAYRQWEFADGIKADAPKFYEKLVFACRYYVNGQLSFRRMTRFSPKQARVLFRIMGEDARIYMQGQEGLNVFPRLCLTYPKLAIVVVAMTYPIGSMMRGIVHALRGKK